MIKNTENSLHFTTKANHQINGLQGKLPTYHLLMEKNVSNIFLKHFFY